MFKERVLFYFLGSSTSASQPFQGIFAKELEHSTVSQRQDSALPKGLTKEKQPNIQGDKYKLKPKLLNIIQTNQPKANAT